MKLFHLLLLCALPHFSLVAWGIEQALLDAVKRGDIETVQIHLNAGADVNEVDARGYNVFHWAAFWGRADIVDLFLRENLIRDINAGGYNENTALHLAAGGGHEAVVARLLEEATLIVAIADGDAITPYHMATGMEREAVRARLLADERETADPTQDHVHYALQRAARRVYIYAVERILAYPIDDLDSRGWANLLRLYVEAGDQDAVTILEHAGLGTDELDENPEDDSDHEAEEGRRFEVYPGLRLSIITLGLFREFGGSI
jgi:ankyrin repeat protein